jgi:predicted small lipoprotein YifL
MKNPIFALLALSLVFSACGQPGPLYLPKDQPTVDAGAKPEAKEKDKAANPEPPPQPEKSSISTE